MLVLTRKQNEGILIGSDISVTVINVEGDKVRIGIEAPKNIRVIREELLAEIGMENRLAASSEYTPVTFREVDGARLTCPAAWKQYKRHTLFMRCVFCFLLKLIKYIFLQVRILNAMSNLPYSAEFDSIFRRFKLVYAQLERLRNPMIHREGNQKMQSISDEYLLLFNALTDAEAELMNLRNRLMNVQRSAEELFIGAEIYCRFC